ncbi:MAG: ABC transporter ATP-binding protein [Mycoplasmoidaceae bacterium]
MYHILKRLPRKDKFLLFLTVIVMTISVMADLMQPLFFGKISQILSTSTDINQIWSSSVDGILFSGWIGMMAGAAVVGIIFNIIAVYITTDVSVRTAFTIRNDMFNKVQHLSSQDVDKISTSSFITRITLDVFHVNELMVLLFTLLVKAPIYFLGGLVLSVVSVSQLSQPELSNLSYIYLIFLLLTFFTGLILYKAFPTFEKIKKNYDNNNSIMSENLIGSRVVRAFNLEENQIARYDSKNIVLKRNLIKGDSLTTIFLPLFTIIMNLSIVFIITYSGFVSIDIPAERRPEVVGLVTSLIQYLNILLVGFFLASFVLATFAFTKVSGKRINEVYALENSIVESKNPVAINKTNISFKNVSFKYFKESNDWAIKDMSFDIKEGQTIGIIGKTGSGKSTIVNLLTRLYDVTEGQITIGDHDIREVKIDDLRENISVSLQEKILFSGTVEENIKVGKTDASDEEVLKASKIAEAYEFINEKEGKFKYRIEERGKNLSGGQKQRVSIARSVVGDPKVLIFDDSTSALDNITERKLLNNLKAELKDSTLIIIAQRINSVKEADKILIINDGKLIGEGTHSYLIKNNKEYKEIYDSQDTSKDK